MNDPQTLLAEWRARFDDALADALPPPGTTVSPLPEAMRHAALAGGKRLRPLLVIGACSAAGGVFGDALPAALAVEMVHTYSLVHDDLPAMDDDDLRRGQPTVHVKFGEATAILAGDALQTLAFEVLASARTAPERVVQQVRTLARAAGVEGMAGGQQLDLLAEGRPPDARLVADVHRRKTGALFEAALRLGAEAAGAPARRVEGFAAIGADLGLAFQIQDDLLDATATSAQLGKTPGKDAAAGKLTWPAAVGALEAERLALDILGRAVGALEELGPPAAPLAALVRQIAGRSR